jgi:hypothetical protein
MYKFYTDKQEVFECSVSLEGASLKDCKARLIIKSNDLNLLFEGEVGSNGKCVIPVRKLKGLLEQSTQGTVELEVIADDVFFKPWKSEFIVETSKKLTVEVSSTSKDAIKETTLNKPKIVINEVSHEIDYHTKNLLYILKMRGFSTLESLSKNKNILSKTITLYTKKKNVNEDQHGKIITRLLTEFI